MTVKRVSAYQATDGELFNSKSECAVYQHEINVSYGVEQLTVDAAKYLEKDENGNIISTPDTLGWAVYAFIMNNKEGLLEALQGKVEYQPSPEDEADDEVTQELPGDQQSSDAKDQVDSFFGQVAAGTGIASIASIQMPTTTH